MVSTINLLNFIKYWDEKKTPTINHLSWYFPQSIMIFYITRRKLNRKYKDCWKITMEITMVMTMQSSGYAYSKLAY